MKLDQLLGKETKIYLKQAYRILSNKRRNIISNILTDSRFHLIAKVKHKLYNSPKLRLGRYNNIILFNNYEASPYISIIIVLYKSTNTIERTINALEAQTYKNLEIVFVDNDIVSSHEHTRLIKENLKTIKYKYILNQKYRIRRRLQYRPRIC